MQKTSDSKIVVFQGDSITDAGRLYEDTASLGYGYAMMIAAFYQSMYPGECVQFVNRGISGDRVKDLQTRWKPDCVDLEPDVVTIMIGINDTWRRYDIGEPTSTDFFEEGYRKILNETCHSTDASIILMEPFVLPCPDDRLSWREDLDPKIQVVRRLAREFATILIPLDGIFAQATISREPEFWAVDGVHPTLAGHALIARNWLDNVGRLVSVSK